MEEDRTLVFKFFCILDLFGVWFSRIGGRVFIFIKFLDDMGVVVLGNIFWEILKRKV